MSALWTGRRLRAAFAVIVCLSATVPGAADAGQGGGGPIGPSGLSPTGLAGQFTSAVPNGPSGVGILSSGIGTESLDLLRAGVLNGAQAALQETASVIDQTTAPRLQSTWFSSSYWRVAGLAALLTLPFLFAAAAQALLRSDLTLLLRAAFGYLPLAVIGVSLAAPITMLLLSVTDEMSSVIAGAGLGGGARFLHQAAEIAGLAAAAGSPALSIAIGLLTLGAAVALAIELVVREAAVYVVVLMLPLAFAALVWPARRTWAVRIVELLIALILSKFVIVAVLSLAGAAYGSNGPESITRLLTAMALVMLSTFAPWVMLRLLPFTELAAGAAGAIRAELPRLPMGPKEAMDAADGAAAWTERVLQRLRPSAGNSDPAHQSDSSDGAASPEAVPAGRLASPWSEAAAESTSANRGAEEMEVNQESPVTADHPAEPPESPPSWLAEIGTKEWRLGLTERAGSDDEPRTHSVPRAGTSGQLTAGSPPASSRPLSPPPPEDGPLPPSTNQDQGLL